MVNRNRALFEIPEEKKLRVIFDSDVKNEVDDQFAIVHALLTESFDIRGIVPTHFGKEKSPHSQKDSEEEVRLLLQKLKLEDCVKIAGGADSDFASMTGKELPEGVRLIIEEARREKEKPLYLAFIGPLTDLAIALTAAPDIAGANIKVLWIGGLYTLEGGAEPNLKADVKAAQIVFDSQIELWQIPRDVYSMLPVSFAELYVKVRPYGEIGKYLSENVVAFNNSGMRKPTEYRVLGDSPTIGILLNENCGKWTIQKAPQINDDMSCQKRSGERKIRVYESIDTRFILEDFYAKLQLFAERG
ncbi:MAG: nucleoside hydrolase [Lachnospiraceae bacterium]|nr:nucleoside hydrolase [Lachnospiraceae bacterium]